jgi:hypothetical protein
VTVALQSFSLSLSALVATVIGALVIALLLLPRDSRNLPALALQGGALRAVRRDSSA